MSKDALLPAPSFDEISRRQLALWYALRNLGFAADDIYVAVYNGGEIFTTLKASGREFNVSMSDGHKVDTNAYMEVFGKWTERWNDEKLMTEAERDEIYFTHVNVEKLMTLVLALQNKGIAIPNRDYTFDGPSPPPAPPLVN